MLSLWTSPDGSVQRLSVEDGPTPAWMLTAYAWQRFQPDNAAAYVPYNSSEQSSTTHSAEASNGQGNDLAEQSRSNCASGSFKKLSNDHSTALQELIAMSKLEVSHICVSHKPQSHAATRNWIFSCCSSLYVFEALAGRTYKVQEAGMAA